MAYGVNAPFGLRPFGHLIGGADNIKFSSKFTISDNSAALNYGDPVMYTPQAAQNGNNNLAPIRLYQPVVTLTAAANATTVIPNGGVQTQTITGVFDSCIYYQPDGTLVESSYWQPGTPTDGRPVIANVYDDPYIIFDIQLGTYMGSNVAAADQFLLLPCLQKQEAGWPYTGTVAAGNGAQIENSAVVGTNLTLCTGRGPLGAVAGGTGSLATVELNGVVAGYRDNPQIADYGTAAGNPWGTSTFYACPSIAATNANPSVNDGESEYARTVDTSGDLRVLQFTPNVQNVPGTFGQPGLGTVGTYFNTPFLNVLVTINKHANKRGTDGLAVVA